MSDRPYSRVYHELADEYPGIYDSCDLAAYVRLLVAADQAWPSSARWAGYATDDEVGRLAESGLVLLDGNRYRIKGMDKEREARSEAGRYAVNKRWERTRNTDGNTDRTADGNTEPIPRRVETSKDETSKDEYDPLREFYDLKAGRVYPDAIAFVRQLADDFGDREVVEAMRECAATTGTDGKFLTRVKGELVVRVEKADREEGERRRQAEAEYQRKLKEEGERMTPEQRQRAAEAKAEVERFIRGLPS